MTVSVIDDDSSDDQSGSLAFAAQWMVHQELPPTPQPLLCVIQQAPLLTGCSSWLAIIAGLPLPLPRSIMRALLPVFIVFTSTMLLGVDAVGSRPTILGPVNPRWRYLAQVP